MMSVAILVAFVLGYAARRVGLPPLVGFLTGGFVLHAIGQDGGETLPVLGDYGVYLLLFAIGLKLRPSSLLRPEIWGVASLHMGIVVALFGAAIYGLGALGVPLLAGMRFEIALLLAFALSFSSTVFAVKVLEESGQSQSLFGRTSIGILIIQDIVAIVFMTASSGKLPNAWALLLLGLPVYRWLILRIMARLGHAELFVLLGLLLAIASADVFAWMGLKPDIAPLLMGIVIGQHPKAKELAGTLLGLKDLFLMLFFLTIGLNGFPTFDGMWIALLFVAAMPFKVALFFGLLTRFNMRARTSLFTSLSLANYSEFGLIVGAVGAASGWISGEWLVIIAISLSLTFVLASPLNGAAIRIYEAMQSMLLRFETGKRLDEEAPVDPGDAEAVVFGMGRVGGLAYETLQGLRGDRVLGLDHDVDVVESHCAAGRNVLEGDPTDPDFVARLTTLCQIDLVLLATGELQADLKAVRILRARMRSGLIAVTASWPEEVETLREAGADLVFCINAEAGADFAQHAHEALCA